MTLTLRLTFPPSANSYWRQRGWKQKTKGKPVYVTAAAKKFIQETREIFRAAGSPPPLVGDVIITLEFYRPDIRRDVDNCVKVLFDALQQVGVYCDDNQVVEYHVRRWDIQGKGKKKRAYVNVIIESDQKGGNEWSRLL